MEEIASKLERADFQNFYRLAPKNSAESAVFFSLEGTLMAAHLFSLRQSTAVCIKISSG